jgi:hypothetical protein
MHRYPLNFDVVVLNPDTHIWHSQLIFLSSVITVHAQLEQSLRLRSKLTMVGDHKSLPWQSCAKLKVGDLLCLQTPPGDVCSRGNYQPLHAYFRPAFSEAKEKAD